MTTARAARSDRTSTTQEAILTAAERSDVMASCYDLLLLLSDASVVTSKHETPEEQRQQASGALRILDRAGRLGPPTRAFHLRRARLLARQGNESAAAEERRRLEGQ